MNKELINHIKCKKIVMAFVFVIMVLYLFPKSVYAETGKNDVVGTVYTFDKDSHYEFSGSKDFTSSDKADTFGAFSISGNITNISTKNGAPAYEVDSDNLELFYTYSDSMLKADEKSWHFIDDKSETIDGKKLDEKIMKGTILLQTSKDRKTWVDVECITDAFEKIPISTDVVYTTKDVQLLNGCYYRLVVVYEARKMVEPNKILFLTINDYEYKKVAEVYEFYAYKKTENDTASAEEPHNLGKKVRTKNFDGYSGEQEIIKGKDAHSDWDLGKFLVSGYTAKQKNSSGDMIFLKNVGDKVKLSFNLEQNIDALDGNKKIYISADTEGYDQYFDTDRMNFGKGALIIQYTNYNDVSTKQYYTNYLEANATVGADTIVQLFEEGDYEVALDYQVTNNKLIDSIAHYRIFFKFSVRNGNCMIYSFDIANGNELTNSSMTDNGFRIDLAKSYYLRANVKREVLTDSADGLVEDIRFNGPAKDGAEYTDEGIYTITVHNEYTNQFTTKKIYVGTNKVLKAYMSTGLSIPEINNLVAEGATIGNDGTITLATNSEITNTEMNEQLVEDTSGEKEPLNIVMIVSIAVVLCLVAILLVVDIKLRKRPEKHEEKKVDGGSNKR